MRSLPPIHSPPNNSASRARRRQRADFQATASRAPSRTTAARLSFTWRNLAVSKREDDSPWSRGQRQIAESTSSFDQRHRAADRSLSGKKLLTFDARPGAISTHEKFAPRAGEANPSDNQMPRRIRSSARPVRDTGQLSARCRSLNCHAPLKRRSTSQTYFRLTIPVRWTRRNNARGVIAIH